jgi:hypothetical protein
MPIKEAWVLVPPPSFLFYVAAVPTEIHVEIWYACPEYLEDSLADGKLRKSRLGAADRWLIESAKEAGRD